MQTNSFIGSLTSTITEEKPIHLVVTLREQYETAEKKIQIIENKNAVVNNTNNSASNSFVEIFHNNVLLSSTKNSVSESEDNSEREFTLLVDQQELEILNEDKKIISNQLVVTEEHINEVEALENEIANLDAIAEGFQKLSEYHAQADKVKTNELAFSDDESDAESLHSSEEEISEKSQPQPQVPQQQQPEQIAISTYELLSAHFKNFMNSNGTTVATTATTVGYGIATVATGGAFNLAIGGGALLVSANEFAKMLKISQ